MYEEKETLAQDQNRLDKDPNRVANAIIEAGYD